MGTRWMMVQYVGNTLRLPIVNEGNMERPFGSSVLERDVQRIVVNPFSDNPHTFVLESELKDAEAENSKLRELAHLVAEYTSADQCEGCVAKRACNAGELDMCWIRKAILEKLRELGVEVDDGQQRDV